MKTPRLTTLARSALEAHDSARVGPAAAAKAEQLAAAYRDRLAGHGVDLDDPKVAAGILAVHHETCVAWQASFRRRGCPVEAWMAYCGALSACAAAVAARHIDLDRPAAS